MTCNQVQTPPAPVAVYYGEELARYGFGRGHPFGLDRLGSFWSSMTSRGLDKRVTVVPPRMATRDEIESFHSSDYIDRVVEQSVEGVGFLDYGDTPAFPGVFEAAGWVVGSTLDAVRRLIDGRAHRAFVPIAGLHHARRNEAGGFCVFNDCGVAIEILQSRHGIKRIAYIDIDAHHGDGVYYEFQDNTHVVIGDIHEDGRFLYPGTGGSHESGTGDAIGTKLNIPLLPGAGDDEFFEAWASIESHIEASEPEFIVLQCGADGLAEDPLTHLEYTAEVHGRVAARLCALADRHSGGKVLALGGGGYHPDGIADGWCAVVEAFLRGRGTAVSLP